MHYIEITVSTAPEGIETLAGLLSAWGFDNMVLEDQAELEGFLEQNRSCWDYIDEKLQQKLQGLCQIRLFLENTDQAGMERLNECIRTLRENNADGALGSLEMTVKALPETDWMEAWKQNYPPQPVGNGLIVLPYWLAQQDQSGRLPVILDPGLTFGTGAHPSTQMVMECMEQLVKPGAACLDLGSGSGILSITALRLGAKSAVGVDIDPKAETAARENAAYNGYDAPEFTALTGNVLADRGLMEKLSSRHYDVVLVNIVADVIIALAPVLPGLLEQHSHLILSGILDTRLEDVRAALTAQGLCITQTHAKEEWRCLCAKRSDV